MFVERRITFAIPPGDLAGPTCNTLRAGPVEHEQGEESTGEFATFTLILVGGHRGRPTRWRHGCCASNGRRCGLATALVPFVHRWDMYRWDKAHRDEHRPKGTNTVSLFVLLPVAVVIKKKLDNLALQKIPIRLVVVDSASTDNAVRLVEDWLAKRGSVFESHEVLKMPVRKERRRGRQGVGTHRPAP